MLLELQIFIIGQGTISFHIDSTIFGPLRWFQYESQQLRWVYKDEYLETFYKRGPSIVN